MANSLKKSTGNASISGTTIYTIPSGSVATIIGLRASNTDNAAVHNVTIEVGGVQISSVETPLPIGGAYEFTDGAKIVAEAGDTIVAYADDDNVVEIYVSMLEQS